MHNHIQYYKDDAVKNRISEFIGSADYIVGYGEANVLNNKPKPYYLAPVSRLCEMTDSGLDIFRSFLDKNGTLISLDVDYYNLKQPAEIYFNADDVYKNKIEPIRQIVKSVYHDFGIKYLEVITGHGYHYHSFWPLVHEHWQLEKIGQLEPTLEQQYINDKRIHNHPSTPIYKGLAYSGAFRLLQFVSLEVVRRANIVCSADATPVQFCDIAMPPLEGVSLDLTIYSDPLYIRNIRVPFSTHQKHKVKKHKIWKEVSNHITVQVALPTSDVSIDNLLEMRRHTRWAAEYARDSRSTCVIPDGSSGWLNVLSKYKDSPLYGFHKKFDAIMHEKEDNWPTTYGRPNLSELPPCVTHSITEPEPHLKKPTNIRKIVAVLSKKGWDYKHIAGFLYSRFKWLDEFASNEYNAETRANFFAQLYGAPIELGIDKLLDMNCVSHQNIGYCIKPWCGYDLMECV